MLDEKTQIPEDLVRIITSFVCGKPFRRSCYARCWTRINGRLVDIPVYDLLIRLV